MKKIISLSILLILSAGLSFSNATVGQALKTVGSATVSGISAANNYLTPWGRGLATYKHSENCVKNLYRYLSFSGKNPNIKKYYLRQALAEAGVGAFDAATTVALTYAYAKSGQKFLPSVPYASSIASTKYGSFIPKGSEWFTNNIESIANLTANKTGISWLANKIGLKIVQSEVKATPQPAPYRLGRLGKDKVLPSPSNPLKLTSPSNANPENCQLAIPYSVKPQTNPKLQPQPEPTPQQLNEEVCDISETPGTIILDQPESRKIEDSASQATEQDHQWAENFLKDRPRDPITEYDIGKCRITLVEELEKSQTEQPAFASDRYWEIQKNLFKRAEDACDKAAGINSDTSDNDNSEALKPGEISPTEEYFVNKETETDYQYAKRLKNRHLNDEPQWYNEGLCESDFVNHLWYINGPVKPNESAAQFNKSFANRAKIACAKVYNKDLSYITQADYKIGKNLYIQAEKELPTYYGKDMALGECLDICATNYSEMIQRLLRSFDENDQLSQEAIAKIEKYKKMAGPIYHPSEGGCWFTCYKAYENSQPKK